MMHQFTLIPVAEIHWSCPHGDRFDLDLITAARHMENQHVDCFSCAAERLLIDRMLSDGSVAWYQTPSMVRTDSRA